MIAYIKGKLTFKSPTYIYVEAGSIGYHLNISLITYGEIENLDEVKLWTYLHVTEDSHTLFGFYDQDERNLFIHLISVSGIGTNTARLILSSMTAKEVRAAIAEEAVFLFNKIKGIGPKTAKRIILDLKDKIVKEGYEEVDIPDQPSSDIRKEATSALISLGFQRNQISKVIGKSIQPGMSVEELIRQALKHLSK